MYYSDAGKLDIAEFEATICDVSYSPYFSDFHLFIGEAYTETIYSCAFWYMPYDLFWRRGCAPG